MTTLRSSLPSRLRQLLHGESSANPHLKLNPDPPSKVKAFIEKVIQSPLQDIAIPLSGFRWQYNKGNFHHWRPLFLHFETYLKTFVSGRHDLLLSDNILGDDSAFPKHEILQILRVMQIILDNCHNKSAFPGLEHFKFLLASTDPDILIATLEALYALVKINPCKLRSSGKLIGCGSLNSCLLSLAQGWGSKEEGLGLYSCILANENTQVEGLSLFPPDDENDTGESISISPPDTQNESGESISQLGSTLYFELHGIESDIAGGCPSGTRSSSSSLILIHNLHLRKEDDLLLLKQCLEQYAVPPNQRFSLLSRIRYSHALRAPRICRLFSRISLLAFMVLVQSDDANNELVSFFATEPEYTNELIRIVRADDVIPSNIRMLAMLALGAQLAAHSSSHERARVLSGSSINFTGGNRTILLNVLQRAVMLLNSTSDPSSLGFLEALLQFYLLHVVSSSNSGTLIRGSGMVPTFLPLLKDYDPTHLHLVCLSVKTLKKLVDCSHSAATLFKDLGGVDLLAYRLQVEVQSAICPAGTNGGSIFVDDVSNGNDVQITSQRSLIKNILKALVSATFASVHSTRLHNPQENPLPATLSVIFSNVEKFGGDIYFAAVSVMSETLHKDPTCFSALHELGLPDAFLSSVVSGVLPSSKALICVPNGLGAICLNSKGLEAVRETSALHFLVDIFTTKKYVFAMNNAVATLANSIEELLRHVSSLRSTGADILIEIVDKISLLMDENLRKSSGKEGLCSEMETESHDVQKESSCSIAAPVPTNETISDEQFIQLCLFHMMVLVQRTLENAETCRLFVEKSGIEALMKLILRPNIAQPSEGMSIALHSTLIFKTFSQHHSTALARAYCTGLRDQLKKSLDGFTVVAGSLLLDGRTSSDSALFYSLFLIEFLLFLAASKDNRWVTALLTEFGSDSKDVLEDIGRLHREVLWQTALLDDAKLEVESNGVSPSVGSQNLELDIAETMEQRFNSFRNLLDPFLRRRTSGWSVDGQIFDLINLYHDLMRTNGLQQQLRSDGTSDVHIESDQQSNGFISSESGEGLAKKEEKQKSCYSSCCDMLRSLSLHITNMFIELGKVMLAPSRRREDTIINVTSSSKAVASCFASIALEHMNFGGHVNSSSSEAMISTKCRYFGKVIDFIDAMILERPESCNPILLNCLYTHGVIHSVLTTFEATNQLLFAVNRASNSSMETDDVNLGQNASAESDNLWIYGPLASYAKFMDHLVTSSFILSPSTKHLLAQPLSTGVIPFPRNAKNFVKSLQSMVLKVALPVWNHPQLPDCSYDFISTVVSIIRHIYSGIEERSVSSSTVRISGTPLNESSISTIVEMGFSRARAEEALRHVGTNSVELAMEWLFAHPEEIPEDDELARALAMSLGNSATEVKDAVSNESDRHMEEEPIHLPPAEELLSSCVKLMTMKEEIAFPIHELLSMMCTQKDGEYRSNVISFLVDQVKLGSSAIDSGSNGSLSGLFHVFALILHEDALARDAAFEKGLVKLSIDLLLKWDCLSSKAGKYSAPKWVTTAFLAIDRMLVVEQKLSPEIIDQLKKDFVLNGQSSVVIDENKQSKLYSVLGCVKSLEANEQKKLVDIACNCMKNKLPAEAMHAVLQLCSTITKHHAVAIYFLESGGLPLLLSLPTTSLFSGYDNVAASIIRHILEDPQTLQQAMESEIRHSFVNSPNRHPNGRLNPRNFLMNLSSAISRDPVVFIQAVQSVCQVEMTGDRPYIVLLKDRDKDKHKEKVKDKEKSLDKDRPLSNDGRVSPVSGQGKLADSNSRNFKVHKRPPQSFVNVIEFLLDLVFAYVPQQKDEMANMQPGSPSMAGMDIDTVSMKGKGKAVASHSETQEFNDQEASTSLAKVVFVLKILTEILLTYAPAINVVLRKDTEISSFKVSSGYCACGVFHHILQKFLPCSKNSKKENKKDGDWMNKLLTRASRFMAAASARSSEARRRIFIYINNSFDIFVESSAGFIKPSSEIQAFIDLLNDALAARTPSGLSVSAEASSTFIDVGLVRSLTLVLKVLDLDHPDSPKVATGIIKALEFVTKEHVRSSSSGAERGGNFTKDSDQNQLGNIENIGNISQHMQITTHNNDSVAGDHVEPFSNEESYGRSEPIPDDMDHDHVFDGGFTTGEDDYMHETSDGRGLDNGVGTVGIRFEIQSHGQVNDGDDDADMSGDEVDEDEDDEDDHNDLEEDEVHHLQHPDTDQEDHEIDDDEFEEEVLEEEDEDDEDEVLFRLEDGVNGYNILENIEVLGRNNAFPSDTFHVMPLEVFGSRNEGRTTSIYSLLGRTSNNATASAHPLLVEPSPSRRTSSRLTESSAVVAHPERSSESPSSQLDGFFRSLRNGRQHGNRYNLWVDDAPQSSASTSSQLNNGLEELLLSVLSRPAPEKSSNKDTTSGQNDGTTFHEMAEDGGGSQDATRNNGTTENPPACIITENNVNSVNAIDVQTPQDASDTSNVNSRAVQMHLEHGDTTVRDVEAVSQESSGSGATLGESLRSLEVEIGSADGHDDGGERQGGTDRVQLADTQAARSRRSNASLGNSALHSARELPLFSVSEGSENPSGDGEQGGPTDDQTNGNADSSSIDPAFLDALPDELRAEVLSAQQGQLAQPVNPEPAHAGDIDPEFLAALPPDIRAEVLAQQQTQRLHQSQELEGQPVEMDTVSIIATFPSELREEVLLTSSDAILANLTPALVAEANMLRERFANRYHNRSLISMYPRSRRGESSRRGDGIDRAGGRILSHKSLGGKPIEAEGAPLVDSEGLKSLIRLLRVFQPLYKGQLQRLLLNLCAHNEVRVALVKIMLDMLIFDTRRPVPSLSYEEPPYRLYACQSDIMCSRSQFVDGIPPLVSRRVLETLTYLARNHPYIANILLHLKISPSFHQKPEKGDQTRGKGVMIIPEEKHGDISHQELASIVLLLRLLNLPLYLRSIAHFEQLLSLLEVIIDNAGNKATGTLSGEQASDPGVAPPEEMINSDPNAVSTSEKAISSKGDGSSQPQNLGQNSEYDSQNILPNLPQPELQLLCSFLAREGLSDNAYVLVAEVLKKLVSIVPSHSRLFIFELAKCVQGLTKSAIDELHAFWESVKSRLGLTAFVGATVLRVIQALSSLVNSLDAKESDDRVPGTEYNAALNQIFEINSVLEPLWLELSTCIGKIECFSDSALPDDATSSIPSGVTPPLPAGAQNILPYIESFFVVCEKLHPVQSAASSDSGIVAVSDTEDVTTVSPAIFQKTAGEKNAAFIKFSDKHRKLLNGFIRQNPGLLEKSFSLMLKAPRLIDFDNKRAYFKSKIKHQHDHHHSSLRISVRRAYVLEDSYNQLRMRSAHDLKGRLTVHFQGEEGIDAGGLTREWYQLLSRVIFDKGALLFTTVGNESTFQPNPNSVYQTEHLSYFKFVGRVVGKALFDGQLLDVHFTRSFYKHILGVKVTYHDIEAIDPDYYKNLKWMLENDITDGLDLTFSIDADEEKLILYERTEVMDYELIPGGRTTKVTEENKHKYVDLVAEHRLTTAIRPQINAFLDGFIELVPRDLISIFNDKELELLISGLPDIDLDDMRANTEYSGYSAASPVTQWFWEVVYGFSKEDKARLLQFVTGTSKVPLEGFSALQGISGAQKFQIHKAYGSPDHLPSAHTCFNQLDLPEYPSKQHLEERLLLAIHEANEGFGFG